MTSKLKKPPSIQRGIEFDAWARYLTTIMKGENFVFFVPPSEGGTGTTASHGSHVGHQLTATQEARFSFVIPQDITRIREVAVRFIPTTTGTIDWSADVAYAGLGDNENLNTASTSATGVSVTDDEISEIDITTLFTDQSTDYESSFQVGTVFTLDAVTTTTDIYVLGLVFKYNIF